MGSRPNSPDLAVPLAVPGSETDQTGTVRISRGGNRAISDGNETPSQRSEFTSAAGEDDDLGESPDASLAESSATPTGAAPAISDMTSAHHSRASSLAGPRDISGHGSTVSLRRARGQERVLSYLSEVSHLSTLTAFGEDLGVPEPPSPSGWSRACANRVDRFMRITFWFLLACIILMLPIYVWIFRFFFGCA